MSRALLNRPMAALLFLVVTSAALTIGTASSTHAAGIAATAKILARLDDDWSKAAATKDAERVASFYADDAVVRHLDAGTPFIQKPFSAAKLLEKIREVLDSRTAGNAVMSA